MITTCKDCRHWDSTGPTAVRGEGGRAARVVLAMCLHPSSPRARDYARPYSEACREYAPNLPHDYKAKP